MINLILPDDQHRLRREHSKRALSAFGFFVMAGLAMGFVMLLPSFVALRYMIADFSYAREVEEHSPSSRALEERTRALTLLELRARDVLARTSKSPSFDNLLQEIFHVASAAGIDLITARFEENTFTIEGHYQHRSSFLVFLHALETNALVKTVSSPLSNLLRETDASFHVTLSL